MRKIFGILLALCAAGAIASADARTYLQVAPEITIPIGDLADITDVGVGMLGGLHFPYSHDVTLTARSGYIWYSGEGNIDVWEVPILAGAHFHLSPRTYFGAEAGVHLVHVESGAFDNTDTELSIVPMIGYQTWAGSTMIDLNGHVGIVENGSYLGARVGFTLGSRY